MSLRIVPVTWEAACEFVAEWHRHLDPPLRSIYRHGVADDRDVLRGVALTGRPVSRLFDDGLTLEITRVATDGTRNASSMLYAAAASTCKDSGYYRVITYNLADESGESLRGAGFVLVAKRKPRPGWNMPGRPRADRGSDGVERGLWERICNQDARAWRVVSRPPGPDRAAALTLFGDAS